MNLETMLVVFVVLQIIVYLMLGLLAGRQSAERLHRALPHRYPGTRNLTRFMSQTRSGRVVAIFVWPVLVSVIQIGFFLGWWDIFGRRS